MEAAIRGNLGADPDVFRRDGKTRTRLRVAVEQSQAEREANRPTVWVDVETWDGLAERCSAALAKGHPVVILGRWVCDEWTTEAGDKRSKTYVKARGVGPDLSRAEVGSVQRVKAQQAAAEEPSPPEAETKADSKETEPPVDDAAPADPFDED